MDVCFHCREPLVVWDGDFDAEDYGYECEGVIHELHCAGCGARITYAVLDDMEEEDDGCEES